MQIKKLLSFEPGTKLMVINKPFSYTGKLVVTLDGGDKRTWMLSDKGSMIAIAVEDEEIVLFDEVPEELESQDDVVVFQGKDYELTYEDAGRIESTEGDVDGEPDDRYVFSEYESDSGALVRSITNENSGETHWYAGNLIAEQDVVEAA